MGKRPRPVLDAEVIADLQAAKVRFLRLSGLVGLAGLPATPVEGEGMTGFLESYNLVLLEPRESWPGDHCGFTMSDAGNVQI